VSRNRRGVGRKRKIKSKIKIKKRIKRKIRSKIKRHTHLLAR